MNLFSFEVITPPVHLPITVDAADTALAAAVVEEIERGVLWRAVVHQTRRIVIDGALPPRLELEPVTAITSLTRWTPGDPAEVVDATAYDIVARDPAGTVIAPSSGSSWPEPGRDIGSFALTYECGWEVTDTTNLVPASILLMLTRAVEFRAGSAGVGDIKIGSLDLSVPDAYATDQIPREIASIGRAYQYRPGLFVGRR